jgi:hypothetical protein
VEELNDIREQLRASGNKSARIPCPHSGEIKYAEIILDATSRYPIFKQKTGLTLTRYA